MSTPDFTYYGYQRHDMHSLWKRSTLCNATTGSPVMWRLRNKSRNSILMMCHYPDPGSASNWLKQISHMAWPIRSTSQIWVVTRHQNGIYVLVSHMSLCGETSGGVMKCPSPLPPPPAVFSNYHVYEGLSYSFEAAIVNEDLPITSHKKLIVSS